MRKYLLVVTILFSCFSINAQDSKKFPLLNSWPISITPLSLWDSDISASAGIEYRFHPSFSLRFASDYIYGSYAEEDAKTRGIRIRQELRYYIVGNKIMNSRSKVWPYISVAVGNKWVNTRFSDWYYINTDNLSYEKWVSYTTHNKEWYIMGRTGMQTAFGKQKRFLFDLSFGLGVTNSKVSFTFPDDNDIRSEISNAYSYNNYEEVSSNKYSGRFKAINFEACFGYRLLR